MFQGAAERRDHDGPVLPFPFLTTAAGLDNGLQLTVRSNGAWVSVALDRREEGGFRLVIDSDASWLGAEVAVNESGAAKSRQVEE